MMTSFQSVAAGLGTGDDAVRNSGKDGFWYSIAVFAILATIHVARVMLDLFLMQRFMLRWRAWLTDRLTGDWLDGKAYYRARFIDDTIDNPDQRIQTDIDIFTAGVGPLPNTPNNTSAATLLFGAVSPIVSMISFTAILWNLSGTLTLPWLGSSCRGRCSGSCCLRALRDRHRVLDRPADHLAVLQQREVQRRRHALVRLRDASEAVAFYRGELAERTGLRRLFAPVVSNYKRYVNRMIGFYGWNLSMSQIIVVATSFPLLSRRSPSAPCRSPRRRSASIQDGLSFFRNAYDQFAGYRAAIIRLHGLVIANEEGRNCRK